MNSTPVDKPTLFVCGVLSVSGYTEKTVAELSLVSSRWIITACARRNNPADAPKIFLVHQGNYGRVVGGTPYRAIVLIQCKDFLQI